MSRLRQNPTDAILDECKAIWGVPDEDDLPRGRDAHPDHLVFWYFDKIMEDYDDVLGPLQARKRLVEQLRTDVEDDQTQKKKK